MKPCWLLLDNFLVLQVPGIYFQDGSNTFQGIKVRLSSVYLPEPFFPSWRLEWYLLFSSLWEVLPNTMTDLTSLRVASQFIVTAGGSSALEHVSHQAPWTYVCLVCLSASRSDPLPIKVHFSRSNLSSGPSDLGFLKAVLASNNWGKEDMKYLMSCITRSLISLSSGPTFSLVFLFFTHVFTEALLLPLPSLIPLSSGKSDCEFFHWILGYHTGFL